MAPIPGPASPAGTASECRANFLLTTRSASNTVLGSQSPTTFLHREGKAERVFLRSVHNEFVGADGAGDEGHQPSIAFGISPRVASPPT